MTDMRGYLFIGAGSVASSADNLAGAFGGAELWPEDKQSHG